MNQAEVIEAKKKLVKELRLFANDTRAVYGTVRGKRMLDYVIERFPPDQPRFKAGEDAYAAAVRDGQSQVTAYFLGALQAAHALETRQA